MADPKLPYRVCDLCGQVDDHPRHVIAGVIDGVHPVDEVLRQAVIDNLGELFSAGKVTVEQVLRVGADYTDTTSSDRHLDCCAAAGCPTGTCAGQVVGADGKTGAAMRRHLLKAGG